MSPRYPITGIAGCCARAATGHAAALLRSVMKSRRRILPPKGQTGIAIGTLSHLAMGAVLCITARMGCPRRLGAKPGKAPIEHYPIEQYGSSSPAAGGATVRGFTSRFPRPPPPGNRAAAQNAMEPGQAGHSNRPALTRRVGCSSTCPGSDYNPHGYRPAGLRKVGIPCRPLDPALWRVPPPLLHRWPDAACCNRGAVAKSK